MAELKDNINDDTGHKKLMEHPLKKHMNSDQRCQKLDLTIDPGFVNHRRIQTVFGHSVMTVIDDMIRELPDQLPEWQREVRIDHIFNKVVLYLCSEMEVPTLGQFIAMDKPEKGQLICSTEELLGSDDVYDKERATLRWLLNVETHREAIFEFSTQHIASDTLRYELSRQSIISFIGVVEDVTSQRIVIAPLIMGFPWLVDPSGKMTAELMWFSHSFYEQFIEDIDEFSKVREVLNNVDWSPMSKISETAFKKCLCKILGDSTSVDWGGEMSDHFTPHLHLRGRRVKAAFLLKGPAKFQPMKMTHLGKNGDQIYRLSCEPADLLVVQHCHEIEQAVRATLRVFAVQPGNPRRYCLIDGRDSFRLLLAYDLLNKALSLSKKSGSC